MLFCIITNLYIDHLNYHGTLKKYFRAKYKIFANQTKNDYLILNRDNKNTKSILKAKPKSKIYFFALSPLSLKVDGIFAEEDRVVFQKNGQRKFICKLKKDFTGHLRSNLLPAMLAAYLYGENWETICRKIKGLPQVPFRQEIIIKRPNLTVINDSAATSPEATIAVIERFKSQDTSRPLGRGVSKLILICGGTDKQLDFRDLAKQIIKNIEPANLFLLEGGATRKLISHMGLRKVRMFATLKDIVSVLPKNGTILFSPGAASFEKFKNEFDRGEQFNKLIKIKFGAKIEGRKNPPSPKLRTGKHQPLKTSFYEKIKILRLH